MIDGDLLRHVWGGVRRLAKDADPPRKRLLNAALEFSATLMDEDKWPPQLWAQAKDLDIAFSNQSSYEASIAALPDDKVGLFIEDFLDLARNVERAIGKSQSPTLTEEKIEASFTYRTSAGSVSVNGLLHLFEYKYAGGMSFWFGVLEQIDEEVIGTISPPFMLHARLKDGREGTAQMLSSPTVDILAVTGVSVLQ